MGSFDHGTISCNGALGGQNVHALGAANAGQKLKAKGTTHVGMKGA
jgi:TPP-dependent pyruvate/acetoin dehydrogenase alpha subunit